MTSHLGVIQLPFDTVTMLNLCCDQDLNPSSVCKASILTTTPTAPMQDTFLPRLQSYNALIYRLLGLDLEDEIRYD